MLSLGSEHCKGEGTCSQRECCNFMIFFLVVVERILLELLGSRRSAVQRRGPGETGWVHVWMWDVGRGVCIYAHNVTYVKHIRAHDIMLTFTLQVHVDGVLPVIHIEGNFEGFNFHG